MNLGFSTHTKENKPTWFTNKIIRSMWLYYPQQMNDFAKKTKMPDFYVLEESSIHQDATIKPKIHTLREDPNGLWKVGNNIHFIINNRTPNRFQFAPVLAVKSIQDVTISSYRTSNFGLGVLIEVDGNYLSSEQTTQFIYNDGFDNLSDFIEWFFPTADVETIRVKCIHWTDFKY